jgi:hypothetical protein
MTSNAILKAIPDPKPTIQNDRMQIQNAAMTVINTEQPGSHNNKYINFDIGLNPRSDRMVWV